MNAPKKDPNHYFKLAIFVAWAAFFIAAIGTRLFP